jgi:septum formation protein
MLSLLKNLDQYSVILASSSPRRFELLKMIGLNFKVRPSHVKEIYQDHLTPLEYTQQNARNKGEAIAEKYRDHIVLSADTIVVLNNQIIQKPKDEKDAREILEKLSGKTHQVITSFGIMQKNAGKVLLDHEITEVQFRKLSRDELHAYINTGEPFDKAGGYGAQGAGALLIKHVNGCFYNVVGLPLQKFFLDLDRFLVELES